MFQTIKARLLAVFLTLGIISTFVFLYSFHYIRKNEEAYMQFNRNIERLSNCMLRDIKVTRDFFSNETINTNYFQTAKSPYLDEHKRICRQIHGLLDMLLKKDQSLKMNTRGDLDRLYKNFNVYLSCVDSIIEKINLRGFKDYGLEGRMRSLAHKLENLSPLIGEANVLTLRKHEKDFIIRQDSVYQTKLHSQSNIIKTSLLSHINIKKDNLNSILLDISIYESKFDSLVKLDKLIGLKSQAGLKKRIDNHAEQIDIGLRNLFTMATEKSEAGMAFLRKILTFFWITLSLIAILLSVIIASKISSSIELLKKNISEFVESDFTKRTVSPIKHSEYEIDVLANHFSILEQHITNQMRALRVKNKELEMFIYRASHDVKLPLTSLNKILDRTKKLTVEPRVIEQLESGNTIVDSLKDIIEELSLVRSIHIGPTEIKEIDAYDMVKKCISGFQAIKGFDDIVFRTNIKIKNVFFSDIKFVRIILRNLIENSIKYRCVSGKTAFVDISFEELENRMVRITVSDNGIGIQKELQKNIFDMFFRATDEQSGNGLGLYIVQNALQKLHGAIKVKSEEGKGSSFIVYLPDATRTSNHAQRIVENRIVFPSREDFALDYL